MIDQRSVDGQRRARVALCVAMVALSAAVLVVRFAHPFGDDGSESTALASNCPIAKAPAVANLTRGEVEAMRAGLRQVVSFDSGVEPYEEGTIAATAAWTDEEPGRAGVTPAATQPGAYEMRWWLPRGEDVVDDAFVFGTAEEATEFIEAATRTKCRTAAAVGTAAYPGSARDLSWLNPEGFAQEDVYLLRDRTVYRVAVVSVGAEGGVSPAIRKAAFVFVNSLACRLPLAGCVDGEETTLARLRGRRGSGARSA